MFLLCNICWVAAKCQRLQDMFDCCKMQRLAVHVCNWQCLCVSATCNDIFQPHQCSSPPSALAFFSHTCYQSLNLPWHFLSTSVIKPAICPGIFQPLLLSNPPSALAFFSHSCYQILNLPWHFLSTSVIKPAICPGIFEPLLLSNPSSALAFFSHSCYQTLPLPWHFSATPVIKPSLCPGIFQPLLLSNPLPWHFSILCYIWLCLPSTEVTALMLVSQQAIPRGACPALNPQHCCWSVKRTLPTIIINTKTLAERCHGKLQVTKIITNNHW
jgi:hypothetical protein